MCIYQYQYFINPTFPTYKCKSRWFTLLCRRKGVKIQANVLCLVFKVQTISQRTSKENESQDIEIQRHKGEVEMENGK